MQHPLPPHCASAPDQPHPPAVALPPSAAEAASPAGTPAPLRRRRLLGGAAAAGLSAWAAGCANVRRTAKAPQVVVVGGGWGGLGAVRELLNDAGIAITLVEPNEAFMSCPLSTHYIMGWQPASDFQRSYAKIDALGVRRVRERALEIDRAKRQVVTATQRIGYDFLVLSPGIEYMEEAIAGYAEARQQLPVGFRAFEQEAVKREVDAFLANGGTFVISAPKPPYRCPPAPYERAFLLAEQMKRRGTKGKIVFLDANAAPMPNPIAKPILDALKAEYSGPIDYRPNTEITAVDMGKRTLKTSAGDLAFSHANLVLPIRASGLVRQAGLGERWAAVSLPRFVAQADDRIYVIGDAQGTPLPKSGHVAFNTGKQVAEEIVQRIAGKTPTAPTGPVELPVGICWANVRHDTAININVASSLTPGQPPQLKFTVDPAHNARSGAGAMAWGKGMWQAMLG